MATVVVPIALFSIVTVALAALVLLARRLLIPAGTVLITINGRRQIEAAPGRWLLNVLADNRIFLPSGCGGRGTCGQCRVVVRSGTPPLMPTEATHIGRRDAAAGQRLACMLRVRGPLSIEVPNDILEARKLTCTVASNRNVSTFLKELMLEPPARAQFDFEAGDYVMIEAPPYRLAFRDFDIDASYREEWQRLGLLELEARLTETTTRVYSLANPPQQNDRLVLVVRIATPPADAPPGTPPGRVSSYLFGLRPGDPVAVSGPYGEFHARDSDKEMMLIGGGAGIAPLRAIALDQLARGSRRKISLWYGVRDLRDLCYGEEFEAAAAAHPNFEYHVALSEPRDTEVWEGPTGFIHAVVHDEYLSRHAAPEDVEYYLCGPPLMSAAVVHMLDELGVGEENIFFDDFGS